MEHSISLQQALSFLRIDTEPVIRAIDVVSANRIAYHPLSLLALRMEMDPGPAEQALDRLQPRLLHSVERGGERAYSFAPQDSEVQAHVAALLTAYRSERNQLRETLSQQAEILRLRDELEFSQDVMHTILNNVGEILIIDLNGAVLASSAFVEQVLGLRRGDTRTTLRRRLTFDPFEEGPSTREVVLHDLCLECSLSDFISRGKVVGKNISVRDVTEQRKLQRARELYEKSRKQLFSIIAHELQNPALGLQSFLQDTLDMIDRILVSGKLPDLEPELVSLKEDAYLNQRGQTLLNRVIGDIFDYVKLQRGQMQFSIESDVSVDYLIALCAAQCSPICVRKNIRLITPSEQDYAGIPELVGDSTRLVQVLNNLVKNALKFTPPHGEIRLSVDVGLAPHAGNGDGEPCVRLQVSDTGRGMTEEEKAMVFTEYRGPESDGMGLGLMISDLIIKAHGGRIEIDSQVGTGSIFRVILPVASVPFAVPA
ncbi:MAG: HAMP domain-containing histidine kinase [Candidatus Latescibacteria bacterium]|nr:HAMP domain-containing histidine kinase [Candidatus Latescibacterota bacterium]